MIIFFLFIACALVLSIVLGKAGHHSQPAVFKGAARPPPTNLLIVGATGGTGRQLVTQALDRGCNVTALVRDPARLKVSHPRLRVIQGDVLDAGSVATAVRGQEAVLCALGHKRFLGPSRILSEGTRNIVRAMEAERVPRLICVTSLGIGDSAFRLGLYYTFFVIPVILPFYFWDKTRQERIVAASNLEWIIVRPGALTNGGSRGDGRQGREVGSFLTTVRISRADVADFALHLLTSNTHLRTATGVSW